MTIRELENEISKLKRLGNFRYNLKGGYEEDGICMSESDGLWQSCIEKTPRH